MKTTHWFAAGCALAFLVTPALAGPDLNAELKTVWSDVQRSSPQDNSSRARADAILHRVLAQTAAGLDASGQSEQPAEAPPTGANLDAAAAQAACSVILVLYPQEAATAETRLAKSLAEIDDTPSAIASGTAWGKHVAEAVLGERGEIAVGSSTPRAIPVRGPDAADVVDPVIYQFTILAGLPGALGGNDGVGAAARFVYPGGIAVDAARNVYVSEQTLGTIRKITPTGVVTTIAGMAGEMGSADGVGAGARFNHPRGLAVDASGNVYVADSGNHTVRKISPAGVVTTLAGTAGQAGHGDGPRESARLDIPLYLTVDDSGNVFVTENGKSFGIRKITPAGAISTLVTRIPGFFMIDTVSYTTIPVPTQLCADHAGNLYGLYVDYFDFSEVMKLTPAGDGTYDGKLVRTPSYTNRAASLTVDEANNLYVRSDADLIFKYAPDGRAQTYYAYYEVSSEGLSLGILDMAADRSGNLLIVAGDTYFGIFDGTIRLGSLDASFSGPRILEHPVSRSDYIGDNTSLTVRAVGNFALTYQWYFNSAPISGATGATLLINAVSMSNAGNYYVKVSDPYGSVTSRTANLSVGPRSTTVVGNPNSGGSTSSGSTGGGSFEGWSSLSLTFLLGAAAYRRWRERDARTSGEVTGSNIDESMADGSVRK